MKIINQDIYQYLKGMKRGGSKRPKSEFTKLVESLDIGDGILIGPHEWKLKTAPTGMIAVLSKRNNRRFKTKKLDLNKGWAILRVK